MSAVAVGEDWRGQRVAAAEIYKGAIIRGIRTDAAPKFIIGRQSDGMLLRVGVASREAAEGWVDRVVREGRLDVD